MNMSPYPSGLKTLTSFTSRRGFTIVELLIVIVVIGILVAITIVAYNGISGRARTSAAQSAVSQASRKILAYAVQNSDTLPVDLATAGVNNSGDTVFQYSVDNSGTPKTYCITATVGSVTSYYENNTTQTLPIAGVCPGHGVGGVPPITNIVKNPSFETNITDWIAGSGVTVAQSSTWASSGTSSIRLTNSSTSDNGDARYGAGGLTSFPPGIEPGKTYTISAVLYIPVSLTGGHTRASRVLYFYSTNSSSFINSFGPQLSTAAGTYTVNYTFSVPSFATGVIIGLAGSSSTIGQVVYYDSVMLTEGSTTYNYADGGSPGWAWNGTAHGSSSSGPAL